MRDGSGTHMGNLHALQFETGEHMCVLAGLTYAICSKYVSNVIFTFWHFSARISSNVKYPTGNPYIFTHVFIFVVSSTH